DWGNKGKLLEVINKYTPRHGEKHLRILVYGPVGAGKSTFINSVTSALYERMSCEAAANTSDSDTRSFTLKVTNGGYSDECYPFVFNDMMGMEGGDRVGIHPQDIKSAMMGHVKEGYKFDPMSPLEKGDLHYNPNPTIDDKVHVLVLMLSANCPEIDRSVIEKMKEVRETARDLGIPQLAVGTHVDVNCEEIKKDIQNIYLSKSLKEKMEELSHAVGLPLSCIMGVKNYSEETDTDDNIDTLILIALRNMVNSGMDFVRKNSATNKWSADAEKLFFILFYLLFFFFFFI
uniref:G domain-containing protein n=1 Tax=Neogobius melanostomus TaxID=47308 RepID=A0A8C6UIX2_9GOBI